MGPKVYCGSGKWRDRTTKDAVCFNITRTGTATSLFRMVGSGETGGREQPLLRRSSVRVRAREHRAHVSEAIIV